MRKRLMRRVLCLAAFTTLLVGDSAFAQEAYSRISLSGGRAHNLFQSDLEGFWEAAEGGEVALATLFHAGELELGLAFHRFDAVDPDVPRFDGLWTYLGWSLNLSPFDVVSWRNGFHVGNYRMTFDEETFQGVKNESELTLGLQSRIDLHFSPAVTFYAAGRYMQMYTSPRLQLAYVSGGVRVTLESPEWLRTVLR